MSQLALNSECGFLACPACGASFSSEVSCGKSCGSSGGCALVTCPACGLGMPHPQKAALSYRLAGWWRGRGKATFAPPAAPVHPGQEPGGISLANLGKGLAARILSIATEQGALSSRLAAMGLVPGSVVKILQRRPALVLELENSLIALDAELAASIRVATVEHP